MNLPASRALRRWAPWTLAILLAACASDNPDRSGLFEPYRFNLQQGNYVTQEMLRQVRPGMTRDQVRYALGSPLLVHAFRTDRWDYVYRFQHASGRAEVRRVVVRFADDKVRVVESDELPVRDDASDPALPGSRSRAVGPGPAVGTAAGPANSSVPGAPSRN